MKLFELWKEEENDNFGMLIDEDEIEYVADLEGENVVLLRGIGTAEIDRLNEIMAKAPTYVDNDGEKYGFCDDPIEWLSRNGYSNVTKEDPGVYPEVEDVVGFDYNENHFFNLSDVGVVKAFNYFDGNTWFKIADDDFYATQLEVKVEGNVLREENLYSISEIDNKKVKGMYLIKLSKKEEHEKEIGLIFDTNFNDAKIKLEELKSKHNLTLV